MPSSPSSSSAGTGAADPVGPARGPRRSRARRVVFALFATMLGLGGAWLLGELALRTFFQASFRELETVYEFYEGDGAGGFRVQAGYEGHHYVAGRFLYVRTNALGLRGPEIGAREAGERRVLFLGDSMPFGHGVEDVEAFPQTMARALATRRQAPVIAGNAGIPRNAHQNQLGDLRRHRVAFDPDVVVSCVYGGNDFHDDFAGPMTAIDGFLLDTAAARLVRSSWRARLCMSSRLLWKIERFLQQSLPGLALDRSNQTATAEEAQRFAGFPAQRYEDFERWQDVFMDAVEPLPIVTTVLDRIEATLVKLREEAVGRPLVVVLVPSYVEAHDGFYAEYVRKTVGQDPAGFRRGLGARRLGERCARQKIPYLDLTPVIAAHPSPALLYILGDGHLSVAGHQVAGEAIARFLEPLLGS